MTRVFEWPEIPMSIAAGLVLATIVGLGILGARRFLHSTVFGEKSANEAVEIALTAFSLFYGILLGLLAVGAYENLNTVSDVVSEEASSIAVLYRDSAGLPQPTRDDVRQGLRSYAHEVVEHSFTEQAHGTRPRNEGPLIEAMVRTMTAFEPRTKGQELLQAETLRRISDLQRARYGRLSNFDVGIPPILWWIVWVGAVINVVLICLPVFPLKPHLLVGCLVAFYIGAMIFVIASLDHPFSGANSVGPGEYQYLLDLVESQ